MTEWRIRIELTPDQRQQLLRHAGKDVESLTVEVLEDRAAPKIFGVSEPLAESDVRITPDP